MTAAVGVAWLLLALPGHLLVGTETALVTASCVAAAAIWLRVALVQTDRLVWSLYAAGASCYATGWVMLFFVTSGEGGGPAGLNLSDTWSLGLYPCWLGATLLLRGTATGRRSGRTAFDGAVVALAVAAAAVALSQLLFPAAFRESWSAAVYAAAYPIGSAVLLGAVLTMLVVRRVPLDRRSVLLTAAFPALLCGQVLFTLRVQSGAPAFGSWVDAVFLAGPLLVAFAAWTTPQAPRADARDGSGAMLLAAAATLLALAVLVLRGVSTPALATVLAAAAITAAVVRTTLFITQEQVLLLRTAEARTDALTGLGNRRALIAALEDTAAPGPQVLVVLDLARFKGVNDSLGHGAGDRLLRVMADRLRAQVPTGLLARLGGDEFAVLLPLPLAQAWALVGELREALGAPVVLDEHHVQLDARFGLAEVPELVVDCTESLRRADVALYAAKQSTSGTEVWTAGLDDHAQELLAMIADLRDALDGGSGVLVHLQPQCHAATGELRSLEALVRWQHPRLGLLGPGRFLPAAESAGLLPALTRHVLEVALADVAALQAAGHGVPVSVNVTAPDLLDPRFTAHVAQALERHGLAAAMLRLEVTETVVLRDPAVILRTLRGLASLGVGLSLDDYGTGLASLSYLRDLPVDELKIDRSFVTAYRTDPTSRVITDSTLALAHDLGLTVVAEGIEDVATGRALADAGCDLLQGWACGYPVPRVDLLARLQAGLPPASNQDVGTQPAA